jgi:hypothetical protein
MLTVLAQTCPKLTREIGRWWKSNPALRYSPQIGVLNPQTTAFAETWGVLVSIFRVILKAFISYLKNSANLVVYSGTVSSAKAIFSIPKSVSTNSSGSPSTNAKTIMWRRLRRSCG